MLKDMCVAVFAAGRQSHQRFIAGTDPRLEVREAVTGFTGFHETAVSYTFILVPLRRRSSNTKFHETT
jgi:hypothetical protein